MLSICHCEEERRSNLGIKLVFWIASFLAMTQSVSIIMMHHIPFHVNCAKWSSGAEVFASTAADAFVFIHSRHFHRAIWTFVIYHLDGTSGAVAGTVTARNAIGKYNAILLHPHGMAGMDGGLFLSRDGLNGTRRTDLAASCTFGTAVAALKRHHGLHKVLEVSGGAQNIVRTTRYAKLASCAMLLHVAC
jgi:hypothetical protein